MKTNDSGRGAHRLVRILAAAGALLAAQLAATAGAYAGYGTNLIANPGAEAGAGSVFGDPVGAGNIPGWTNTAEFTVTQYGPDYGYPTSTDPGPLDRGANFFAGGPDNALSWATQAIDVSFLGGASANYTLSGWLGGYLDQSDNAVLQADFLNSSSAVLGSASIGPVSAADRGNATGLLYRETAGILPAGTASIGLKLSMTRTDGTYNDGYADNLSFVLTPVPEPGSWLLTLAGIALIGFKLRRGV